MASLQSSFTPLSTTKPLTSPFAKPSQLATANARRSHRFQVSCSSGGSQIDRRNMLLGLGGLYGAGSLVLGRSAQASPILPPDLSTCDPKGATTTEDSGKVVSLDVNCCPPFTNVQIDYKLPEVKKLRVRPAAHRLSRDNLAKYELAMKKMRELDVTDPDDPRGFMQQANVHCAYCNGPYDQVGYPGIDLQIHNSWTFFPFHRWYLYFYERILGELIGDPTFALPYWNWDNPAGMMLPPPFDNPNSPLYDVERDPTHHNPALVILTLTTPAPTDPTQIISNNLTQMYREMIGNVSSATDFMGDPYTAGMAPPTGATAGTSEGGSHTGVHSWTGNPDNTFHENMGNFYSAGRDPAFYSHHANVDRMWSVWKSIPADYSKDITEPDFLNASFLFYDEKKNLVKVKIADALDMKKMGYVYEHSDTPWMASRPPKRQVPVNFRDLSEKAKTTARSFPLKLNRTVRFIVPKPTKGAADETLILERIVSDNSKLVRFDVFVNDEDDKPHALDRAEYLGGFTQLPHRVRAKEKFSDRRLNLKELYENINIADDDSIVVTIVPQINGDSITIGGIKIIPRAT
ncbi:hypothetical protein OROMI_022685 [Orobanche minor]